MDVIGEGHLQADGVTVLCRSRIGAFFALLWANFVPAELAAAIENLMG